MNLDQPVTLRNGHKAHAGVVTVTLIAFRALGPVIQYEAVMLARDPNHALWGNAGRELAEAQFGELQGSRLVLHTDVKQTLLNMAEGDGMDMTFRDPRKPRSEPA